MLIENIMHSPVITIEPGQSIAQALAITQDNNIRHLPVVENGKLVGILSDRDLRDACPSTLESNPAGVLANTPVSKIMHSKVITLHPLDFFDEAVRLFYEHKISSLPVVSNGLVVGIVTETDVLNHLVGMLGILSPGSYLEVEIPDRPGVLAEITQIIKNHGVNVSSVLLCP
ncbi:MAG TPA: CBS and ACT domain-containing protein, partial [Verrucomicrobiae bacterium]|nr:CBS and ACT domain-containing protein [Verrucomicrobiae bacterium]